MGNVYLTENRLSRNEIILYVSHMCKGTFRFELYLKSYWQNIIFEIAQNFTYLQKS